MKKVVAIVVAVLVLMGGCGAAVVGVGLSLVVIPAALQQQLAAQGKCATGGLFGNAVPESQEQPAPATRKQPKVSGFSAQQVQNAATIIAVGRKVKLPPRARQIALMTAMVESQLINVHYGDRDSQGLFQQRPSSGWGSIKQITNPELSAAAFYGKAKHTSNPGLVDIKGWQSPGRSMGDIAQQVQRSAFPDRYAERQDAAAALVKALEGSSVDTAPESDNANDCANTSTGGATFGNCPALGRDAVERPGGRQMTPDALRVIRCGVKQFPEFRDIGTYRSDPNAQDHALYKGIDLMIPGGAGNAAGTKSGDAMASWLVKNHKQLGVHYVIWNNRIWNAERDKPGGSYPAGWRAYGVCQQQACGDTLAHRDHVHVSVWGNKGTLADDDGPGGTGTWQNLTGPRAYMLGPGICKGGDTCWGYSSHTGQDLDMALNAKVYAVAAGTVKTKLFCPSLSNAARASNRGCSYGRLVMIKHSGNTDSYYAHLNNYGPGIKNGTKVKAGQLIGYEGSQGNSSGPHVHVEIRRGGVIVNPVTYLERQGVQMRCSSKMRGYYGSRHPPSKGCS